MLESYLYQNNKVKLYYEGLEKAKVEYSDNFYKQCRFYSLQQMVKFVLDKNLLADFAECGCWKGHSTYIISKMLCEHKFLGTFHVFDSFEEGLSEKGLKDKSPEREESEDFIIRQKKWFSSTEEEVSKTIEDFSFIKLYKGWIPDRFKEVQDKKFAFVHIDVDLYQPTLDSLRFFFPRLLSRGVVVIDDYGYADFPGSKKAVDEFLKDNDYYFFYETPIGACFIIK